MIPASALALLLVLALVPGWLFLRLTETLRRPISRGPLLELLEVVAVGLATTGVTAGLLVLSFTSTLRKALKDPLATDRHLSSLVLLFVGCLVGATLLAGLAAWGWSKVRPSRYRTSVWEGVLSQQRDGKIRFVTVEMTDGRTFAGQLGGFTLGDSDAGQQVALIDKIWVTQKAGVRSLTRFDSLVIDAERIAFLAMSHVDPGV